MGIKEVINWHMNRLSELKEGEQNKKIFYIGVISLLYSFVLGYFYSWWVIILGFIVYGVLAYKSVKW